MDINKEFISPVYDCTFKWLWKNEECRKWFIKLIKHLTDVDLTDYSLYDPEINSGNNLRDYRLDIILTKNNCDYRKSDFYNIEMYKNYYDLNEYKSNMYLFVLMADGFESGDKFVKRRGMQINFHDYNNKYDKDLTISQHKLRDFTNNLECDDITIYNVYLPKFEGICYNGDENELEASLALLHASSYEEMRKIASGNKEALNIVDSLERLSLRQDFMGVYDAEKVHRKEINTARSEGYEEGIQEGKIQAAKAMLERNISIDDVCAITGLNKDEINEYCSK